MDVVLPEIKKNAVQLYRVQRWQVSRIVNSFIVQAKL